MRRDTYTGRLFLLEQHKDNVGDVDRLDSALSVAASSDNQNVYVSSNDDNVVSVFGRIGEFPDTYLVRVPVVLKE